MSSSNGRNPELYIQLSMLSPESYALAGGSLCVFTCPSPVPRRVSEDSAGVIPCGEERAFFVVADGMGGCPDGQQASKIAVETFELYLRDESNPKTDLDEVVMAAFNDEWWDGPGTLNGFTHMERNFSLYWGLAIHMYEATLVSDQTPWDLYEAGDETALTEQEQRVTEAQRFGRQVLAQRPPLAHDGEDAQPVALAEVELAQALAGELRTRREDRFGHADRLRLQIGRLDRTLSDDLELLQTAQDVEVSALAGE